MRVWPKVGNLPFSWLYIATSIWPAEVRNDSRKEHWIYQVVLRPSSPTLPNILSYTAGVRVRDDDG